MLETDLKSSINLQIATSAFMICTFSGSLTLASFIINPVLNTIFITFTETQSILCNTGCLLFPAIISPTTMEGKVL